MIINIFKSTPKVNSNNYFPELDGLRGLAVIFVFFFHLNNNGIFQGGFIGVDIFFIISGYLITGILYKQINSNSFNYQDFIAARIARLYPSLLIVISLSLITGYFIYTPQYFLNEAESGFFATLSLSNWYFSQGDGYWNILQIENPFLHTWSLGIEQQFYLLWPLLLLYILKTRQTTQKLLLITIILLSFSYSIYLGTQESETKAFYSTFTRMCELTSGGLLFLCTSHNNHSIQRLLSNIKGDLTFTVSILILFLSAIFFKNYLLPYPNFYTIIIISSTMLCIISAQHAKYTRYILNNPFMVFIGLISYSIYLLHWPIIVFTKYWFFGEINLLHEIIIFITTIFLSYLLYILVENRFRKIKIFSRTDSKILLYWIPFFFIICIQAYIFQHDGLNNRKKFFLSPDIQWSLTAGGKNYREGYQIIGDKSKSPLAIIAGDSFAQMYIEAADNFLKEKGISVIYYAHSGCQLLKDINYWNSKSCAEHKNLFFNLIKEKQLPIIYIQLWSFLTEPTIYDDNGNKIKVDLIQVAKEINNIQIMSQNKIMFLGMPPMYSLRMNVLYNRTSAKGSQFEKYTKIPYQADKNIVDMNNFIENIALKNSNMEYLNIYDYLCDTKLCFAKGENNKSYYHDSYHLSKYGAETVWSYIGDIIYQFIIKNSLEPVKLEP